MKTILFISSTSLSINPRCRKEIELAIREGYKVKFLGCLFSNWTMQEERKIQKEIKGVDFHYIRIGRSPLLKWLQSIAVQKFGNLLFALGFKIPAVCAWVVDRRSAMLMQKLREINPQVDLIIAHNPGAFYPAFRYSKRNKVPFAFDIEDFHPGEGNTRIVGKAVKRLMTDLIPRSYYTSYASPLIRQTTEEFARPISGKSVVINNVFPAIDFKTQREKSSSALLELVWFSQNIDYGRGLEEIFPILDKFAGEIRLTLIGNPKNNFVTKEVAKRKYIAIIEPLPQEALHRYLTGFDVGLAIESTNADFNRDLCLTNKIWAYLQAGLIIWATNTSAQSAFARQYSEQVSLIDFGDPANIELLLSDSIKDIDSIRTNSPKRFQVSQTVSWESESERLLQLWKV
jgi:hypothetical protein